MLTTVTGGGAGFHYGVNMFFFIRDLTLEIGA